VPIPTRIKKLFSRVKWPGWFAILVAIFIGVPDWNGRIDFWLKAAKGMGGYLGLAATIAASPWFLVGLVATGLGYLAFVGEVEKPVRRHPGWIILGWTVFGIIALAFSGLLLAGYVAIRVAKQASVGAVQNLSKSSQEVKSDLGSIETQIAQIQQELQQSRPRVFTDDQRQKLVAALKNVPTGKTYNLMVEVVGSCNECSGYANDLMTAWNGLTDWKIQGSTNFGLNPRLTGVVVGIDPKNCPPDESKLLSDSLDAANINHSFSPVPANFIPTGFCGLFIGNKPRV
jgi:hypothetical protein